MSCMGYSKKVMAGFSWESLLKISNYILAVIKIYFLARILSPNDFGLFSLATIALGISEAVTQTGINLTIIQSKHSVKYFLDTAWVIAIIRGFIIGIIMLLLGFGMSSFFHKTELVTLIALAALIPVIKGFINPYVVVLHKKMRYFEDNLYRFCLMFCEIILAIACGYWLKSASALVIAMIGSALIEAGASFLLFGEKPIFNYSSSRAKIIFNNAKGLSLGSFLIYLVENIDDFLIGAIISTPALGIYHNAYSLTHKANYQLAKSVHYGTIPVYTKIANNRLRLKKAFLKAVLLTTIIIFIVSTPIFIFNQEIITFFLGEQWLSAIPLIRPLLIAGVIQSYSMISYTLMLAQKKYAYMNLHLAISLISMVGLMLFLGNKNGLVGAVNAVLISRIISIPPIIFGVRKVFKKN